MTKQAALHQGSVLIVMRHAATEAGIGDPPGFQLGDCTTQRNLSPEGRAQAQRFGAPLAARCGLPPLTSAIPESPSGSLIKSTRRR